MTAARSNVALFALVSVLALPTARAHALFHIAVIDEVMTSYGGDPNVQFVEILMLLGSQQFVSGSVLSAFDDAGNFTGIVHTVPSNVSGGTNRPWLMATAAWQALSGIAPDFVIPAGLPTTGGMACWGKPLDETVPTNYVDCLAYGTYSGPTNVRIGTPTTLDAVGHSLQRLSETNDNLTDFACADPATPTNNSFETFDMAATVTCTDVSTTTNTTNTTTTTTTLAPVPLCGAAPSGACISGAKTAYQHKNDADDSKDSIKAKVTKGDAFAQADLGNPASTTRYSLCVYDETGDVPALVGELVVPAGGRWLDKSPKGWAYKDKLGSDDGVTQIQLKPGDAGKAKMQLKSNGATPSWPAPVDAGQIYSLASAVTVQLVNDATATCWSMSFTAAQTKKNDGKQYKAAGSGP